MGVGSSAAARARALAVAFHHIHVNEPAPADLLDYYAKLFNRETTFKTTIGDVHGIEAGGIFLLVTQAKRMPEEGAAGWHFGWGTVALDEAYDRHRMQEIDWELPLESYAKGLHLHLESADPVAAADWYRDTLGAEIQTAPAHATIKPKTPVVRLPVAIVRFDGVALAIYKALTPIGPSRGHRIDHIAFKTDLAAARATLAAAKVKVLEAAGKLGPYDTMMIEGPDQLAIELVGAPTLRR